jgi:NADH-quinone oxidoreductase subunit L
VIEAAYMTQTGAGQYAFWMVLIAALFTSFYSWRLIFMTFHGRSRADAEVLSHAHESPKVMLVPLMLLAVGALLAGGVFYEYFVHHHYEDFWKGALFTGPNNNIVEIFHDVPKLVKYSPMIMMATGFLIAFYFYIISPQTPVRLAQEQEPLYKFLLNKWYFDELYDVLFVRPAKAIGRFLWKKGDGWLIDGFGPDGVAARVKDITGRVVRLQTGYLYHYAFVMLAGVALLVTWFLFQSGAN